MTPMVAHCIPNARSVVSTLARIPSNRTPACAALPAALHPRTARLAKLVGGMRTCRRRATLTPVTIITSTRRPAPSTTYKSVIRSCRVILLQMLLGDLVRVPAASQAALAPVRLLRGLRAVCSPLSRMSRMSRILRRQVGVVNAHIAPRPMAHTIYYLLIPCRVALLWCISLPGDEPTQYHNAMLHLYEATAYQTIRYLVASRI